MRFGFADGFYGGEHWKPSPPGGYVLWFCRWIYGKDHWKLLSPDGDMRFDFADGFTAGSIGSRLRRADMHCACRRLMGGFAAPCCGNRRKR